MTEFFRFTLDLKAKIYKNPRGVGQRDIYHRVQQLAGIITGDKDLLIEVYKITFIELLLGDYYSEVLRSKLKQKKEREIILPVSSGLNSQDAIFFEALFKETLNKDLGVVKDNALNLLFSQFGSPVITDARLEYCNNEKEFPGSECR